MKAQLRGDHACMQQHGAGAMLQRSSSVLTRCYRAPLRLNSYLKSAVVFDSSSDAGQSAQFSRASAAGAGAAAGAAASWKLQLSSHGAISRGAFGQQRPRIGFCRAAGENKQHASRSGTKALPSRSHLHCVACMHTFMCAHYHSLCTIQQLQEMLVQMADLWTHPWRSQPSSALAAGVVPELGKSAPCSAV